MLPQWLIVVIEGIVEGLTEFLPISSTGHLILTSRLLDFKGFAGIFEIFIQIGAIVAVLLYYWPDLWQQIRTVRNAPKVQQHWLSIIVAFLPIGIVGFLLSDYFDLIDTPFVVAVAMIVGGIMFLLVERFVKLPETSDKSITENPLSLKQAFLIGCWQIIALIPGMSRSGMSIVAALAVGVDRKRATEFSFYLALPTLGIASVYSLLKNLEELSRNDLGYLVLGAVVSGIVAWFAIGWLLRYVSNHNFLPFAYYRIIIGLLILMMIAVRS